MAGKATDLIVYGPYPIPYVTNGRGLSKQITKENADDFWSTTEVVQVSRKQGCYVFALKAAKGYTPWYVGKATKAFKQEALHETKRSHYNEVIYANRKGTPVMFFVARPGDLIKVAKSVISDMETFLIQSAYFKNPYLRNTQHAKDPSWGIRGVIRGGKGRAKGNANSFRLMLKL